MKKVPPAASPDDYVANLGGWQRDRVMALRKAARSVPGLQETIKWGHLVYLSNGPALLIRAEEDRVLFGFWRGKRLVSIEPRLKPGGQYEMATLELREDASIKLSVARQLVAEAVNLNRELGDPQAAAGRAPRRKK